MKSIILIGFCPKNSWQKYSALLLGETELSESLPPSNEILNEYLSERIENIKNVNIIKPSNIDTYCVVFSNSEGKPRYYHPKRNAKLVADSFTRIIIKITKVEKYNPDNNMSLKNIVPSNVKPVNKIVRSSCNNNSKIVLTSMHPFDYYDKPIFSRSNPHRSKVSLYPNPKVNKINPGPSFVLVTDGRRILVVLEKGKWSNTGGNYDKIDKGSRRKTAYRELMEEAGCWVQNIDNFVFLFNNKGANIFYVRINNFPTSYQDRKNIFKGRIEEQRKLNKKAPIETQDYGFYNPETGNVECYDGTPKPTQQWRGCCLYTCVKFSNEILQVRPGISTNNNKKQVKNTSDLKVTNKRMPVGTRLYNSIFKKKFIRKNNGFKNSNKRIPVGIRVSNSVFKNKRINGKVTGSCLLYCIINRRVYFLLLRKCMKGERDKVQHRTNEQRKKNLPWSIHGRGAAGTDEIYWGMWCTVGGTLSGDEVFKGVLKELQDECGVRIGLNELDKLPFELLDEQTNNLACEITDLSIFPYINYTRSYACFKELIFSSHGEIAEIRLVPLDEIYDKKTRQFKYDVNCRNGLTSYVEESFRRYYIPMLVAKGLI